MSDYDIRETVKVKCIFTAVTKSNLDRHELRGSTEHRR